MSIERSDDDELRAVPQYPHVLLKADAAYTPNFSFLANPSPTKVPIMQVGIMPRSSADAHGSTPPNAFRSRGSDSYKVVWV